MTRPNLNITTWLFASLSLFEGSPAIQSLLMALLLLLSGTAFHRLRALIFGRFSPAHPMDNGPLVPARNEILLEKVSGAWSLRRLGCTNSRRETCSRSNQIPQFESAWLP